MTFALGPQARAAGYRLEPHDTIGSTSSEATARAQAGDPGKLWIVTGEQTDGRGRRGRNWQTPRGNLAASLVMRESDIGPMSATLGFVAGLALQGAIAAVAGASSDAQVAGRLGLKWPNDVMCDGAKVAGILLEAVTLAGAPRALVIGIGVNVLHAPKGVPYPATSLAERGISTTAEALFEALGEAWAEQAARWNAGRGFAGVRERWLTHAVGVGNPISVDLGDDDVVSGIFETIDDEGRLIVRAGDGSARPVSAGDVHFGAAATAGR